MDHQIQQRPGTEIIYTKTFSGSSSLISRVYVSIRAGIAGGMPTVLVTQIFHIELVRDLRIGDEHPISSAKHDVNGTIGERVNSGRACLILKKVGWELFPTDLFH